MQEVLAVHVGQPQAVRWRGQTVTTSIFKRPVEGPVAVRALNLDGDRQSDLSVHGGPDKAVYLYPAFHYPFWRDQYPGMDLPWGMFGENLTVSGLREDNTHIGDTFRVGTAEFAVTQPRLPCYKLGIRFGRPDVLKRMLSSGHTGFYLRVLREGHLVPGDPVEWLSRDPHRVSVYDLVHLVAGGSKDRAAIRRALQVEALSAAWRDDLSARLAG